MSVIRYINNSDKDVVAGGKTVPAYDQLITTEIVAELHKLAGKSLMVLVDGVDISEPTDKILDIPKELEVKPELVAKQVEPAKTTE